ncbi:MAG: hypothetical protein ACFFDN_07705 [Candidatus Hodarchaeota archaeon]
MKEMLKILKHDLHKLKIRNFKPHKEALTEFEMKKADGVASWFSRNGKKQDFDMNNRLYVRDSYVVKINKNIIKNEIQKKREKIHEIFRETDPLKLHSLILKSKLLNKFAEAQIYPYSSFKYHLLLTCAFYWNLKNKNEWQKLYLCENAKPESIFQIIYKDEDREWALLPNGGMSRVFPEFSKTWVRRMQISIGGDIILDGLLSQIKSWSAALATIEDWCELNT